MTDKEYSEKIDHLLAEAFGLAKQWLEEARERETESAEEEEHDDYLVVQLEELYACIEDAWEML